MSDPDPTDRGVIGPINLSKRDFLAAAGGAILGSGMAGATDADGDAGKMYAGTAALSQEYNTAGNLWIGPDSTKSNVPTNSGNLFLATDTQVKYYGDGSSWVKMGVGSSSEAVEEVYTKQIDVSQSIVWGWYDGYGYKPFPISDYSDIGAAVNAAVEERTNHDSINMGIKLPAGEHLVTTTIDGGTEGLNNVGMHGWGPNNTILKLDDSQDKDVIGYTPGSTEFFASFANFTIDGNKGNNTSGRGLQLGDIRDVRMEHVFIEDTAGRGCQLASLWGYRIVGCIFERAATQACLDFTATGSPENGYMESCRFGSADGVHGFYDAGSTDLTIVGCEFDNNELFGVYLTSSVSDTMLYGCRADGGGGTQSNGYRIVGDRIGLVGCTSSGGGGGIQVDSGGSDTRIVGHNYRGGAALSDSGTRTIVNGRYWTPPTISLGGSDGVISPTDNKLTQYHIRVDAGGSNSNLQGIDTIVERGTRVTIEHTGGENVVLEDDNSSASNPLKNTSGSNETLDANGEMAEYVYDGSAWRQAWSNTQA